MDDGGGAGRIKDFVDAVNSPGGHVLVCLVLLVVYSAWAQNPMAHDVTIFALGVLGRSMGSAK